MSWRAPIPTWRSGSRKECSFVAGQPLTLDNDPGGPNILTVWHDHLAEHPLCLTNVQYHPRGWLACDDLRQRTGQFRPLVDRAVRPALEWAELEATSRSVGDRQA